MSDKNRRINVGDLPESAESELKSDDVQELPNGGADVKGGVRYSGFRYDGARYEGFRYDGKRIGGIRIGKRYNLDGGTWKL